jgi:hypothetical protein
MPVCYNATAKASNQLALAEAIKERFLFPLAL